jgi:cell division protein FtsI/penicillin-binding protein 2
MARAAVIAALLAGLLCGMSAHAQPPASLRAQSTQSALMRQWPAATNPRLAWIVLDLTDGEIIAQQGIAPERPIPVGSLTKPFLALAYAHTHVGYPHFTCRGMQDRCWLPRGHGALDLQQALAYSCNAYFLALAAQIDPAALANTMQWLNLPAPPVEASPATLIGLDPGWQISPLALAHAYGRLTTQSDVSDILAGLRQSASTGTASALHGEDALAKTGTAPCHHRGCLASADGLVIVLTPAANPRTLLFVRQQGSTGAATARIAAQMLLLLEAPHGP